MSWTDERVERLKELLLEGLSASQIAAELGEVTRNAVIGKLHRLGLSKNDKTKSGNDTPDSECEPCPPTHAKQTNDCDPDSSPAVDDISVKSVKKKPVSPHIAFQPENEVIIPISRKLKLLELTEQTCKWPNGDPATDDFYFCGEKPCGNGPYCEYHSKLALQTNTERRQAKVT